MTILDKIKEWNKLSFLPKGYKANNLIFKVAIGLCFLWLVVAAFTLPEKNYFVSCRDSEGGAYSGPFGGELIPCENPFFRVNCERLIGEDSRWCFEQTIPAGVSFGTKPNFFYTFAETFCFLIMLGAVLLNHFLYNKEWRDD